MIKGSVGLALVAATLLGAAPAQADILIGLQAPLTGPNAAPGELLRRGFEQAVKDINAKGGVLGQKLATVEQDDACDPKQSVTVANLMVNRKVAFVDGSYCSGASIPASSIYADAGILQIVPSSTSPLVTELPAQKGWINVYRTCGRDDQQGVVAGAYLAQHFGKQPIAIIDDRQTYGKGLADETRKALNKAGVHEAMDEVITAGDKDFSALISKMKAKHIAVMYFGGYVTDAGVIVRQAHEQGLNIPMMSGAAMSTQDFWQITGNAGNGTLFVFNHDPMLNPQAKQVVEEFSKTGFKPEGYTLYSYATVQVFAQAAQAAGSTKIKDLAKVLHSRTFHTVLGDINFDKKGDPTVAGYVMWQWKDGTYHML